MAKIVFYEDNIAGLVEGFMKKVHDPAVPDVPNKMAFLDSKDLETRIKISPDDDPKRIAIALCTTAGLIPNLIILYPCYDGLEEVVKEYIIKRECSVDMAILRVKSDDNYAIKDLEYIEIDPSNTTELSESTFVPETKKILYLMTSERATELVKNATQNSAIHITDVAELASHFKYNESVRVSIAIPQLSAVSWVDFFDTLELILEKEPIDAVYIECPPKKRDYFLRSMVDILERNFNPNQLTYAQNEKSYVEVVEREPENAEEAPTVEVSE